MYLDIRRLRFQRLKSQAAMLRTITERLLCSAGIDVGMRVLDLGCGAGDVSMLAALQSSVPNFHGADRLVEHFSEAGLPYPNLFSEELVGGSPDSLLCGSLAELLQSQLEKFGSCRRKRLEWNGLKADSKMQSSKRAARSLDLRRCVPGRSSEQRLRPDQERSQF